MSNEQVICEVLHRCGVAPHLRGYLYILKIVEACLEDEAKIYRIVENYREVGKVYDASPSQVERCVKTAIMRAWLNDGHDFRDMVFRNTYRRDKGYPMNSEFLGGIVQYIKLGCPDMYDFN